MQIKLIRHLWGVNDPIIACFQRFKKFGYTGIEAPLPAEFEPFKNALEQYSYAYIPQIFTGGNSVDEHLKSYRDQLEKSMRYEPLFVNAHSTFDSFTIEDATKFYSESLKIDCSLGVKVAHETHRGRFFFNPWNTNALLDRVPEIQLCCDFSHWVVVCERLLQDSTKIIERCAKHCLHVHARVGYEEGPQVPDPSAPEYENALKAHESWWDIIWMAQKKAGVTESTLTPEFGPPGYLHTLPHTNVPVANLEKVCDWMADRQRTRFKSVIH